MSGRHERGCGNVSNTVKHPIEIVIENNNRYFTEWSNQIKEHTAKVQKVLDDKTNGIEPDPAFIQGLKDRLMESGILDKDGNVVEFIKG